MPESGSGPNDQNLRTAEGSPLTGNLHWRLKRLGYLWQRTRGSIALRGWRGTLTRIAGALQHRPVAQDALSLLPLDLPFVPLALPVADAPRVSVIIPVHGKLAWTLACLRSIARDGADAAFEVIVVDDASPDDSAAVLAQISGLQLLCNAGNLGFSGSCNAGAAVARGEFLLFLNNDTQVTPGWLDALLRCFAERADCGIAGSRLVYPDGRLQEAGALVFADGSGWATGRFEPRDAPAFRYRRETDYVSGAALLIRCEVFRRIGGFDARYAPAYYEDTDLAFAVRRLGLRVYYEPASTVIHCEGITAGTDLTRGIKRHQRIHQATFTEKWAAELAAQPPVGTPLRRAIRWRARGRVLVVDSMTPEPTRDSGSLRLCAILRLLDEQGWSSSLLPDDGRASATEIAALGALGCEVLCRPWVPALPRWLREHGRELHAVILCRHTVAGQYVGLVRRHAPQARLLFDTVDLHFLREQRAAELAGSASLARQAEASRHSELALIAQCDVTFVVSPHEQALLAGLLPQARVELLSNIHEVHGCRHPQAERRDLHAVILCRHTVAGQYAGLVRRHAPQARLLFDTVDLHFLREQRAAELGGSATLARQAEASRRSELALIAQCDVTFVVSPHERALLAELLPQARVELLSNIHEVHGCRHPQAERRDLVFIGGYGHPPNSDAIRWIAREILPRLREALPQIRLHVLGDLPDGVRRELATPGLELHGRVADLAPWLDRCLASLAPLRFGAGVKGKINMAMSHGVPVVATPLAVEGMQLSDGVDVLVADDADGFVAAVLRLQRDAALWHTLSAQGLANVQQHFSTGAAAATLHRVLD